MKLTFALLLATISIAYGQSTKGDTIAFCLTQIESQKFFKLYKQIDSLQLEINKKWINKMNSTGLGYDERNIIQVLPSRRDSLKVVFRKH